MADTLLRLVGFQFFNLDLRNLFYHLEGTKWIFYQLQWGLDGLLSYRDGISATVRSLAWINDLRIDVAKDDKVGRARNKLRSKALKLGSRYMHSETVRSNDK
jgi:hypothetical protein